MNFKRMNRYKFFIGIICFIYANAYSFGTNDSILVAIDGKKITKNDFIRRAEFTIRPPYCKQDTYLDKKIILNSLIAEKLLAIEAEKSGVQLNINIENYLKSRNEQLMRMILINNKVKSNVSIDSAKVNNIFKYAGRDYSISYVSVKDSLIANQLKNELIVNKKHFDSTLIYNYGLKEIPTRNVQWNKVENYTILDSLFCMERFVGEVVGPIKAAKDQIIFLKINSYSDSPAITDSEYQNRLNSIKNSLEGRDLDKKFNDYVLNIMTNKKVEFNEKTFLAFTDFVAPIYLNQNKERENLLKEGVWNYKNEELKYLELQKNLSEINDELILKYNNENWDVNKLMSEIKNHPLVFREKKFANIDFGYQLQIAIMDLIRDKELTKIAYNNNYDTLNEVIHENEIWKDNFFALSVKYKILKMKGIESITNENFSNIMNDYLNPAVNELQKKYSNDILINFKIFNNINITRTDMAVSYSNSAFPAVVPEFPILTNKHNIDYAKKVD